MTKNELLCKCDIFNKYIWKNLYVKQNVRKIASTYGIAFLENGDAHWSFSSLRHVLHFLASLHSRKKPLEIFGTTLPCFRKSLTHFRIDRQLERKSRADCTLWLTHCFWKISPRWTCGVQYSSATKHPVTYYIVHKHNEMFGNIVWYPKLHYHKCGRICSTTLKVAFFFVKIFYLSNKLTNHKLNLL